MNPGDTLALIERALDARQALLTEPHNTAVRLFNGFSEGCPELVVDLYAASLVLFNYADPPDSLDEILSQASAFFRARLPWLTCALVKTRAAVAPAARSGQLLWGSQPARRVRENGVWYALDLTMHQDASLYLDTRGLRAWLSANTRGVDVLNTFAYTGSLGAACLAGGAARVLQVDLERRFLNLAKDTCSLNGWPVRRADFLSGDFFRLAGQMRRRGELFDLVILDPPFFSATAAGRVDLVSDPVRLINKLRPLVRDGGRLVAVNNALFTGGQAYLSALEELAQDGYLALEEIIPVPEDVIGYPHTRVSAPPVDPAPFNHPTKIAVLRVKKRA
jgi:23S rRNA (cytosine1962-C5)-methyltransferase